ncbi:MAG: FAD-dependent oxidoreductase [Bacteroidetes bacterium]|nr:FAD-dependent oxidoreductase [Bacteroidota bacterium]
MYDLIIIGAGPAGMTAAIYAARRKIDFLIISMDVGGQMTWSSEVKNYPGTNTLTGIELSNKFQEHMKEYKINVKSEEILKLSKKGKTCVVKTKQNKYESKAVIITTGKKPKKLGVPGEDKYLGKGVNYCATCDAPLFKGKIVAVAGGGNSGLEAVLFLAKYAKKVYLMEVNEKLGGEAYLRDKVLVDKKITVITGIKVEEILGKDFVNAIKTDKGGKKETIKVDGIFVEIGLITEASFTDVEKNKWGEIKLFRGTKTHNENLTSVPGIFAAGDCTDIPAKQIIAAAGEGCKAALASFDYILKK